MHNLYFQAFAIWGAMCFAVTIVRNLRSEGNRG